MSISYEYYKIFYYVAQYKSFSTASKILSNSQPNITRIINNLESELDCRLFVRSNRGVALTEAGEKLFEHVQNAHKHFQMGESEIVQLKENHREHLSIGFSIGINEVLLHDKILPVLHDYHTLYPNVRIRIINDSTPQLISNINEGLTDMAIITSVEGDKAHPKEIVLNSFRDVLAGGPSYAKLTRKKLHLSDLIDYPIINLWQGTETYSLYSHLFMEHGLSFEPEIETATTNQVLSFIAGDMGIGFMSPAYAKTAMKEKKIYRIPLAEELPTRQIRLIQNPKSKNDSNTAILSEMICHESK